MTGGGPERAAQPSSHAASMLEKREKLLGPNNPYFYDDPIHVVRGDGVWLYDHDGRRYLDCYNNVAHVGHCHPHVVEAICQQTATLNTHSRYLHSTMLDYAERLTATFSPGLDTLLYTCTGSEANDVALRMARSFTGNEGLIVTDYTYHGNTALVMELATSFPREERPRPFLRTIPAPDSYHLEAGEASIDDMGERVLAALDAAIESLQASGQGLAAILFCPIFANEGFPDLPPGFAKRVADKVHAAGGVVIADEVQSGFGRTGEAMWGHQYAGFTPDIVTMGKPMGNGYPIAGVVARSDIMSDFRTKNLYFNTFAANPVACAAASATLDVLEQENLIGNARDVGRYAKGELTALRQRFPCIGDIRGSGLFFGAEFVSDPEQRKADPDFASRVMNRMRANGVIMGLIGRKENLLKIRPPMPFQKNHVDQLINTLSKVLEELTGESGGLNGEF